MRKKVLLITLLLIGSLFIFNEYGYSQINIGNLKNKAKNVKNKVKNVTNKVTEEPDENTGRMAETVDNETDNEVRNNDYEEQQRQQKCDLLTSEFEMQVKTIEEALNDGNYEMAESYLKSSENSLIPDMEEYNCGELEEKKSRIAELRNRYEEGINQANQAEEEREFVKQFIKEAKWSTQDLLMLFIDGTWTQHEFTDKNRAQLYYDKCKEVDYVNKAPDADAYKEKYPDIFEENTEPYLDYQEFRIEFPKKLDEYINDHVIKDVNYDIEYAYELKGAGESQYGKAMEVLEAALLVIDGSLLLVPENKKLTELRKDVTKAYKEISELYGKAVYASDVHKKYAGKMVFATKPIVIKQEDENAFKNSFTAADDIYCMMYFKGNYNAITNGTYRLVTIIYVDGNQVAEHEWSVSGEERKKTYNPIEIIPDPETSQTYGAIKYMKALSDLSPRKHTVKVVCMDDNRLNTCAEGEFELDCGTGLDVLKKKYERLKEIRLEKVRMPKAKMNNPVLEHSIIQAMKETDWKEKPLRAVITSDSWIIHRNILGAIMFREIWATVAFKDTDGKCYIFDMAFKQDFDGRRYGKTKYYSVGGKEEIKCANVWK